MSLTTIVVTLVIILIAIAFLLENMKRSSQLPKTRGNKSSDNAPITANESGPTQTGRFRVKQMLQKTTQAESRPPKASSKTADSSDKTLALEEDEEELPDPFAEN